MSVARVTEISATSPSSFDDAVKKGLERAAKTLRHIQGAWIKDMNVLVDDGRIKAYKVNMEVSFVLDDED
jgi:dodecin